jgi:acetoin:2,6-dichlorophenolindophenol oxidoreductase subunit alpha
VDEATEIAKASPAPSLEAIDKDVWADGGTAWRN